MENLLLEAMKEKSESEIKLIQEGLKNLRLLPSDYKIEGKLDDTTKTAVKELYDKKNDLNPGRAWLISQVLGTEGIKSTDVRSNDPNVKVENHEISKEDRKKGISAAFTLSAEPKKNLRNSWTHNEQRSISGTNVNLDNDNEVPLVPKEEINKNPVNVTTNNAVEVPKNIIAQAGIEIKVTDRGGCPEKSVFDKFINFVEKLSQDGLTSEEVRQCEEIRKEINKAIEKETGNKDFIRAEIDKKYMPYETSCYRRNADTGNKKGYFDISK